MNYSDRDEHFALRHIARGAFITPALKALTERRYDDALRLVAAGVILADDPSLSLDAEMDEPHRFALWRLALKAFQHCPYSLLHSGGNHITSVGFSSDGMRAVTGHSNGTAASWDVTTGKTVCLYGGHDRQVNAVAFSRDSKYLLTASDDRSARVFDVESGTLVDILRAEKSIRIAIFSPDGARAVVVSDDGTARILELATHAEIAVLGGHPTTVRNVAFSPDGKRVATGSGSEYHKSNSMGRIWDSQSGQGLAVLSGHENAIGIIAFSPDGSCIITGSYDQTARIWDAQSGAELAVLRGHESEVGVVALSPDGTRALTGSPDGTIRTWYTGSGAQISALRELRGYRNPSFRRLAISPDWKRAIVHHSELSAAATWDLAIGAEIAALNCHEKVKLVAFSPDGTCALVVASDGSVRQWNPENGKETHLRLADNSDEGFVILSGDGKRGLDTDKRSARVWDLRTGATLSEFHSDEKPITPIAFSFNGSRVITASTEDPYARRFYSPPVSEIRVWDANTGDLISLLTGHERKVLSLALNADGTRAITGLSDDTARVWDVKDSTQIAEYLDGLRGPGGIGGSVRTGVTSVAFSADGTRALTGAPLRNLGAQQPFARVWHVESGKEIADLFLDDLSVKEFGQREFDERCISTAALSADGTLALTGSHAGTVRLWHAATGAEVAVLGSHKGYVASVAFSADGTCALSGSYDGTVKLWDLSRWTPFEIDRGVFLAAALDCGLGIRNAAEEIDLLMRWAPHDLFAALMERLTPDQRARVPEVSRRLRRGFHPNCYLMTGERSLI